MDNFGGRIALVEGDAGDDPAVRVLLFRLLGDEEPSWRVTTIWKGDDERHSLFEIPQDGEWVRIREIVHERDPR